MNKILKRGLIAGGVMAVVYQGFRCFRIGRAVMNLHKALPEHLNSIYGETPKLGCSVSVNLVINVSIWVRFSAETLQQHTDIEDMVKNYIADFCPELITRHLEIYVTDLTKTKFDLIKERHPKIYKRFGKLIEKKLKAEEAKKAKVEIEDTEEEEA